MAQAKVGDILRVEWDEDRSRDKGIEVDRGPFDGRVVAHQDRQVVVEFRYRGSRELERITLDLRRRLDLTNNAVLAGVTIIRPKKAKEQTS